MTSLEEFLESGFEVVPPSELGHLVSATRDTCYATGDVRYCIASECLEIIASCWGDDGAVRHSLAEQLESFICGEFAAAIRDPDPEAARSLALGARASLLTLVGSAGDFIYG